MQQILSRFDTSVFEIILFGDEVRGVSTTGSLARPRLLGEEARLSSYY